MIQKLLIRLTHDQAITPAYQSAGAACFDLHALIEAKDGLGATGVDGSSITMAPGNHAIIRTGLAFEVPPGWVMEIHSRSGHGFKHNIRLSNCTGQIDSDYRGEVQIALHNDSRKKYTVRHGDRIAQAKLVRAEQVELVVVDRLSDTARGAAGFGSTGA